MKIKNLLTASLITAISLLSSQESNAQFSKGAWMVEGAVGNISYGNSKSDDTYANPTSNSSSESKNFYFSIYPTAGYFVTNNLVIGASLDFSYYNSKYESFNNVGAKSYDSKSGSSSLGIAPFVRFYFPGKEKLRFYGQLKGGVDTNLSRTNESTSYNTNTGVATNKYVYDYTKNYLIYHVTPTIGLNYSLSQNVLLNGGLGYRYSKSNQTYDYTNTNLITNVASTNKDYGDANTGGNISWTVGFTMILPSGGGKSAN